MAELHGILRETFRAAPSNRELRELVMLARALQRALPGSINAFRGRHWEMGYGASRSDFLLDGLSWALCASGWGDNPTIQREMRTFPSCDCLQGNVST